MPIPVQSTMGSVDGIEPGLNAVGQITDFAYKVPVKQIAGTAYTCLHEQSGMHFSTTTAATSCNFTLPAVAANTGVEYWFSPGACTSGVLTITAPSGTLCCQGNIAGASVVTTTLKSIGINVHVFCDGAKWMVSADTGKIIAGGNIFTVS
jgi:hypothetical protein